MDNTPQEVDPSANISGWEFFTPQNWTALITIEDTTDPETYFLGPFNDGDDGAWSNTITEIRQNFACDKDSKVNLVFTFVQCGDWDLDTGSIDFFRYGLINSVTQSLIRVQGNLNETRPGPSQFLDFSTPNLNSNTNNECEDGEWEYRVFGNGTDTDDTIELMVEADETFQVRFEIATTTDSEWGAITGVTVTCTALDHDGDGIPNSDDNV